MLKPKKRITRKELKEDGLLSTYTRASAFYYENQKYITYVITALVVILIAGYVFIRNKTANNEKAATELGKVFTIYDAAAENPQQYQTAINGQPERGIIGLKKIVDEYGGTDAGNLATFYLANAYYYTGQFDQALEMYEDFSADDALLEASAVAGIGACHEAKKELGKAASYFEKAASLAGKDAIAPEYLSSAARNYAESGEKEKAITLYKRIKKEYPTSTYAREVDRYITQISA